MKLIGMLGTALLVLPFTGIFAGEPGFPPVKGFELSRYLGTWYEIARMPNWFERDLVNVTATYSPRDDGKITVLNQGYKPDKDGKLKRAKGRAKFAGDPDTGYLKVSFFGPFYADYIIIALDKDDYQYALVAGSKHKFLWILSRSPQMDQALYERLIARAVELGFDRDALYKVPQDW